LAARLSSLKTLTVIPEPAEYHPAEPNLQFGPTPQMFLDFLLAASPTLVELRVLLDDMILTTVLMGIIYMLA